MAESARAVFICATTRTPFGRYGGALSAVRVDELAALPMRALQARLASVYWAALDEVILGCGNQAGEDNRNVARMASLLSGLPTSVPALTVNRLCASGLEAAVQAARMIALGDADLVMAGGVEGMSRAPYVLPKAGNAFSREQRMEDSTLGWRMVNPAMRSAYGVDTMAETAENLAREHDIVRADQDGYALRSQERTARAALEGRLAVEITPVTAAQAGREADVMVDEQPRALGSLEKLAALKPLPGLATITAGNASGLNDGACALLLASEAGMRRHGLQPLARVLGAAAAGVAPRTMGLGPVPAIGKLLARLELSLDEFDRIEINEAFAAQVLACTRALGLPDDSERVNPHGGAIALGHPLAASGARLLGSAALGLARDGQRRALISLCVGVGQGLAMAIERP
ncbi:MAG: acetyl-CoA C-acyltransferase [Arenimonas sp.]